MILLSLDNLYEWAKLFIFLHQISDDYMADLCANIKVDSPFLLMVHGWYVEICGPSNSYAAFLFSVIIYIEKVLGCINLCTLVKTFCDIRMIVASDSMTFFHSRFCDWLSVVKWYLLWWNKLLFSTYQLPLALCA